MTDTAPIVGTAEWINPNDRSRNDRVNLPRNGPAQAVWLYNQIVRKRPEDRDVERARLRAEFAKLPEASAAPLAPYLEMALTWPIPDDQSHVKAVYDHEWELASAVYKRYRELNPIPKLEGTDTDTTCRHGVKFSAPCQPCDEDFA